MTGVQTCALPIFWLSRNEEFACFSQRGRRLDDETIGAQTDGEGVDITRLIFNNEDDDATVGINHADRPPHGRKGHGRGVMGRESPRTVPRKER